MTKLNSKKPKSKRKVKAKADRPSMYFGKNVEDAIIEYNDSDSEVHKRKLFNIIIYPAFSKLVENVIHNRKLYEYGILNYAMVKQDCICHLFDRIPNYALSSGKAFSYFNRVTINWIFAFFNKLKKDRTVFGPNYSSDHVDDDVSLHKIDYIRDLDREIADQEYADELEDFVVKWSEWGNSNLDYFYFLKNDRIYPFNHKDKQIANAIFDILSNCRNIDIYNKKALYLMIRDRVDVKTQSITDVVNVLKGLLKDMYLEFKDSGTKYWHRYLYYPDGIGEISTGELEEIINEQGIDIVPGIYW